MLCIAVTTNPCCVICKTTMVCVTGNEYLSYHNEYYKIYSCYDKLA